MGTYSTLPDSPTTVEQVNFRHLDSLTGAYCLMSARHQYTESPPSTGKKNIHILVVNGQTVEFGLSLASQVNPVLCASFCRLIYSPLTHLSMSFVHFLMCSLRRMASLQSGVALNISPDCHLLLQQKPSPFT